MRRLTLIFSLAVFLTSCLSAQGSFNFSELTKDERDSLKKGVVTAVLREKFETRMKKDSIYRDSFIQHKILNQPIADFDARDTAGMMHRLSMYRGRVWIIHFWDFWENSFQYEIPSLNAVVDSLRGEGVEVLSFLNYSLGETERKYMADKSIRYPIIENAEKFGNAYFGMHFYRPFVGIIDKKGVCRYFYDAHKLHLGFPFEHRNELLDGNKPKIPAYDFMEKVKNLLRE